MPPHSRPDLAPLPADPSPDSTCSRLLAAATEVFAAKGYEAATVREICRLANVNVALVNYHFESKRKLYRAVVERLFASGPRSLLEVVATVHDEASWRAAVRTWLSNALAIVTSTEPPYNHIARIMAHESAMPSEVRVELQREFQEPLRRDLCRLVRMALPEGLSPRAIELETRLWCSTLDAICLAHASVRPRWDSLFRPAGVSRSEWLKAELGWMCRSVFAQLHFRRVVD